MSSTPGPHEGESHLDEQSETTSPPVRDDDPPVRTARTPAIVWGLWLVWTVLGIALVVAALVIVL